MRNTIKKIALLLAIFALAAGRCVPDSEEQSVDEDQATDDAVFHQKKEATVADWSIFKKKANTLFSIAQSNIDALRIKVDQAKGSKQAELDAVCATSDYDLSMLTDQLQVRDKAFTAELKHYNDSSAVKNNTFKQSFLRQLVEINQTLEKKLGE